MLRRGEILEVVRGIEFRKGPFFADVGDFSAAGAARLEFWDVLPQDFVSVAWGENNHRRLVLGGSTGSPESGAFTAAVEAVQDDGPFQLPEDFARANVFLRYHHAIEDRKLTLTATGYSAECTSTDQIPTRAITDGNLNRFGYMDPTDGGDSERFSLTFAGMWDHADAETRIDAYVLNYGLDLYSNFTYFLDDPVNGDQFEQVDDRNVLGATLTHSWHAGWEIALNALNLLDQTDNDIEYYYASRLPGEPARGIEDIHLHPVEPRTLRVMLTWRH